DQLCYIVQRLRVNHTGGCNLTQTVLSTMQTRGFIKLVAFCTILLLFSPIFGFAQQQLVTPPIASAALELSRPVRPWEFVDAVGMRAGLLGRENGDFEGWVYPLKL